MNAIVTLREGHAERSVAAQSGAPLAALLRRSGAGIDMPCGGNGTCGACAVLVNGERRLACRTAVEDGMRVELIGAPRMVNIAAGAGVEAAARPLHTGYGLSVDIGTTTLCAALLGMDGAIGTAVRKNPQTGYGADVISRVEKAMSGALPELASCVRGAIRDMIAELAERAGISAGEIDAAVVTGNTAMLYLLTGRDPAALSRAPFAADRLFGEFVPARELGLPIAKTAPVYLPRCVSAFVGGDITTAILACGMCDRPETALMADIGTNGEIALWRGGELICCSTAAGPAFEGAGISQGVYGIRGAIDHVWLKDGAAHCSTIGGAAAAGICGSGIVDALAVMLALGVVDETGAFEGGAGRFEIAGGVGVSAADVRKLQLAKGSIRAGMETLLKTAGAGKDEVDALYIAGGFGSFIDLRNAAEVGLIPAELLRCARSIGNAAHAGASMLLQDSALIEKSEALAGRARTVALDANPVFAEQYIEHMLLGPNGG